MKTFRLTLLFMVLLSTSWQCVYAQQDKGEELLQKIRENPKNIREYDVDVVLSQPDYLLIGIMQMVFYEIPINQISRSDMKRYYIPIALKTIEEVTEEYDVIGQLSEGKESCIGELTQKSGSLAGADITGCFMYLQKLYYSILSICPFDNLCEIPIMLYGCLRSVEKELYGKSTVSNRYFPIPEELSKTIAAFVNVPIENPSVMDSLLSKVTSMAQNGQYEKIYRYYRELLKLSLYYDISMQSSWLSAIENSVRQCDSSVDVEKMYKDYYLNGYQSDDDPLVARFSTLLFLRTKNTMKVMDSIRVFSKYKDELVNRYHYEFANYAPSECPEQLMTPQKEFDRYAKRFISVLDLALSSSILDVDQSMIRNFLGASNSFSSVWSNVLHEAVFAWERGNVQALTVFENCVDVLNLSAESVSDLFLIASVYSGFNLIKMRDILNKIRPSVDYSIECYKNVQSESAEIFELVYNVANLAYYYSLLKNPLREESIRSYLSFVNQLNLSKEDPIYDDIQRLVSESYMNIGNYDKALKALESMNRELPEDLEWHKKNIQLHIQFESGEENDLYETCKEMDTTLYNSENSAIAFFAGLTHEDLPMARSASSTFKEYVGAPFSDIEILNPNDREYCQRYYKRKYENIFYESWLVLAVGEFVGDSMMAYRNEFASMVYDYSLSFKGCVLRADMAQKRQVRNVLDEEFRLLDSLDQERIRNNDTSLYSNSFQKIGQTMLYGALRSIHEEKEPVNFKDVQNSISEHAIIVEFVEYEKDGYFAVILRKGWEYPVIYDLVLPDAENYEIANEYNYSDTAWMHDMYRRVWKPIEQYVRPMDTIYFSLDGSLNLENVELFMDADQVSASEKYQLRRVATTAELSKCLYLSDVHNAAVFGDLIYFMDNAELGYPAYTGESFGLPGYCYVPREKLNTRREVDSIISVLSLSKQLNVYPYLNKNGTERNLKSLSGTNTELLHIASHGFICNEEESDHSVMERTGIIFSGSDEIPVNEDGAGILLASEISELDLSTVKLLVLSACNTGVGESHDDGVFGIQRGFLQAGVESIIMTLWPVNDKVATEFMSFLYRRLLDGEEIHTAFMHTQRHMKESHSDNNWKTFVLLN